MQIKTSSQVLFVKSFLILSIQHLIAFECNFKLKIKEITNKSKKLFDKKNEMDLALVKVPKYSWPFSVKKQY
jgi:hypothetical protein